MPIIISRETGEVLASSPITPAQNETLHKAAMPNEYKFHPERFEIPVTASENEK